MIQLGKKKPIRLHSASARLFNLCRFLEPAVVTGPTTAFRSGPVRHSHRPGHTGQDLARRKSVVVMAQPSAQVRLTFSRPEVLDRTAAYDSLVDAGT